MRTRSRSPSYQGGHVEFFKYMLDLLRERGAGHIKVFGGGGGVIVPAEMKELHDYGVARLFLPEDGQRLGLIGMISEIVSASDVDLAAHLPADATALVEGTHAERTRSLARMITGLEAGTVPAKERDALLALAAKAKVPTLGVTGTGGRGKSSLTDEIVRRFRLDQDDRLRIAIISIDPVAPEVRRRAPGGSHPDERDRAPEHLHALARDARCRERSEQGVAGRDRRVQGRGVRRGHRGDFRHRPGRRGDRAARRRLAVRDDARVRSASQLEKIDMLDFADFVAINKFDRKGAQDALRDVRKQVQRNREAFKTPPERCRSTARWLRASTTTASPRFTRRSHRSSARRG
jgi:methylmalonyl-CoA mutase